jgi:four helix bundle protein
MGEPSRAAQSVTDLRVFVRGYALAMRIFELTKSFPRDERFSLTDQIRRSSRSVSVNLSEAWAKRRYTAHFVSKLTDSDGENLETANWLMFAKDCGYIPTPLFDELLAENREIGKMLGQMIKRPEPFLIHWPPSPIP